MAPPRCIGQPASGPSRRLLGSLKPATGRLGRSRPGGGIHPSTTIAPRPSPQLALPIPHASRAYSPGEGRMRARTSQPFYRSTVRHPFVRRQPWLESYPAASAFSLGEDHTGPVLCGKGAPRERTRRGSQCLPLCELKDWPEGRLERSAPGAATDWLGWPAAGRPATKKGQSVSQPPTTIPFHSWRMWLLRHDASTAGTNARCSHVFVII